MYTAKKRQCITSGGGAGAGQWYHEASSVSGFVLLTLSLSDLGEGKTGTLGSSDPAWVTSQTPLCVFFLFPPDVQGDVFQRIHQRMTPMLYCTGFTESDFIDSGQKEMRIFFSSES